MFTKNKYDTNVPTLLLSGTLDPDNPVKHAQDIEQRLNNATHIVFQNRGHVQFTDEYARINYIKTFIPNRADFTPPECVNEVYKIYFNVPEQ